MANTYGNNLELTIFGGSHDREIGMTLTGFPAGIRLPEAQLLAFMARRAPGQGPWATARKEPDTPVFTSGVTRENDADGHIVYVSDGTPMRAVIINQNQHSADYASLVDIPRPSHADYPARVKFGVSVDLRGGGKYSGRLTAPLCIAGAFCLALLRERGIHIGAILTLTEGSLAAVSCTAQGPAACARTECCQTKPMWDKLDKMIDEFFEGITLEDLIHENA